METARTFFALNLDVASVRRIVDHAAHLPDAVRTPFQKRGARSISPAKMHVTVRFFGSIDLALVPALTDAVAPLVVGPPPRLSIARATAFPDPSRARVVVLELDDPSGGLARLYRDVDARSTELGLPSESRPYRPHLTLFRLRAPADARAVCDALGEVSLAEACVTELVLYRSDLGRGERGSADEYTPLARFPWPTA